LVALATIGAHRSTRHPGGVVQTCSSSGTCARNSPTSTGANRTPWAINIGSSVSMMKSDAGPR
jgi:hypothetical protein